ncbi:MAG TPA: tRNA preQ1(34) S-adenosylmethionine ribosyltransferase-isomerase QueA [Spirochaetales bacterium]|nr:tRNA preQ1(34) S-adenosylmethionine ribosyltransferase-isomerase QueA [Spirochaetales bacterium]
MKTREFFFNLPPELIAQYPTEERGHSRLLVVRRSDGSLEEGTVGEIASFLPAGSVMVFNDSKVRKARVYGVDTDTGKEREFLFIRSYDGCTWEVITRNLRKLRRGKRFLFPGSREGRIEKGTEGIPYVQFQYPLEEIYFDTYGNVPLPPYIRRATEASDEERYQTVYARSPGSVAAPTAGLHFTPELLSSLDTKGIERLFVTLHVGLGTFEPIRTETIEEHQMHREEYEVSPDTAERINRGRREGRKIVAVGTTSVRVLESAWQGNRVQAGRGSTDLFITPGYTFQVVDHLFTNFHTPGSTLMVLVAAFAGKPLIDRAYAFAVKKQYRFFSYGDAMLIL